jgi:hypothetical protein
MPLVSSSPPPTDVIERTKHGKGKRKRKDRVSENSRKVKDKSKI